MAGKGDKRRPMNCTPEEYAKNFEAAFGKAKPWWETRDHKEWVKKSRKKDADDRTKTGSG